MKDRRSVKVKAKAKTGARGDRPLPPAPLRGHDGFVKRKPVAKTLGRVCKSVGAQRAALLSIVWVAASACGPSFQAIYEGNARFEHCYALEENPQATMPAKADCWRDWSEHYTYGQTRDRVQYAIARYVALSQAPTTPTDEALMNAAPGVMPRVNTISAPAPTSAFAPPPKVLVEVTDAQATPPYPGVAALASATIHVAPPLPDTSCADQCSNAFRVCGVQCVNPAPGSRAIGAPCTTCDDNYRACMRACFK
ncbi:MAG: hypothetical protein FWD69_06115 [Polyangiaceae bacterium]|nr:hypothetical protein [Polyangiaceae bacterium]